MRGKVVDPNGLYDGKIQIELDIYDGVKNYPRDEKITYLLFLSWPSGVVGSRGRVSIPLKVSLYTVQLYEGHMLDFDDNLDGDQNIDNYDMVGDTSSAKARVGKDIQGIPWERLNITREGSRRTRLEQYLNYENIPLSREAVVKEYNTKVGNKSVRQVAFPEKSDIPEEFVYTNLEQVYMTYVQALYGGGGWPLSVFLSANLISKFYDDLQEFFSKSGDNGEVDLNQEVEVCRPSVSYSHASPSVDTVPVTEPVRNSHNPSLLQKERGRAREERVDIEARQLAAAVGTNDSTMVDNFQSKSVIRKTIDDKVQVLA
ncbi:uncharacterized WD repeat-containing protein-like protein isoform X2, partial [Tanacetum coccineum]